MKCYVCDNEITEQNETVEHILLNAIGGRLTSKKLICINCNSVFGSGIDDELAAQLNPISTLLDIKRHRGTPQNIKGKAGNKEIILEPGGKMKLARAYYSVEGNKIHIEAPNVKAIKTLLNGLKRTYQSIDVDKMLKKAENDKSFLSNIKIDISFGGKDVFRAICKMAINYYLYIGGSAAEIKHLLPFINKNENEANVYYFYPRNEVLYKGEKDILHSLILVGDPLKKTLYVYIELFNEFKFIVYLSQEYNGENIKESYHYNVVTNEIVNFEEEVTILNKDIKKFATDELNLPRFEERMKMLFQRIDNVTVNKKITNITESAIEEMINKYPQKDFKYITEEMIQFVSTRIAVKFVEAFNNRFLHKKVPLDKKLLIDRNKISCS